MAWAVLITKTEPSLRARAMRLLARREHSREELRRKLAAFADECDNVEQLLDDLGARGWLSDARFAEQAARAKARRFGPLKVVHFLRSRGLADEIIAVGLLAAGADGVASIDAIWRSRFRDAPRDEGEKARQVRFLQGRGFPLDEIFRFLRQLEARP
jgi:regulatory protein